jgi:hypothetical protein
MTQYVLALSVDNALKSEASHFEYYSLALDKSTDVSNTAQLVTCVHEVNNIIMLLKK